MTTRNSKRGSLGGGLFGATIALLLFLSTAPELLRPVSAEKPQAPLALTLQSHLLPDGQVQLVLSARARLDADAVTLSFHLPPAVTQVDDAASMWSGPLAKDDAKTVVILVRGTDEAIGQVVGHAAVKAAAIGTYLQEVRRTDRPIADLPIEPVPFMTHDGDDPILEYPGD